MLGVEHEFPVTYQGSLFYSYLPTLFLPVPLNDFYANHLSRTSGFSAPVFTSEEVYEKLFSLQDKVWMPVLVD